jgi:hypothetical protein
MVKYGLYWQYDDNICSAGARFFSYFRVVYLYVPARCFGEGRLTLSSLIAFNSHDFRLQGSSVMLCKGVIF